VKGHFEAAEKEGTGKRWRKKQRKERDKWEKTPPPRINKSLVTVLLSLTLHCKPFVNVEMRTDHLDDLHFGVNAKVIEKRL